MFRSPASVRAGKKNSHRIAIERIELELGESGILVLRRFQANRTNSKAPTAPTATVRLRTCSFTPK